MTIPKPVRNANNLYVAQQHATPWFLFEIVSDWEDVLPKLNRRLLTDIHSPSPEKMIALMDKFLVRFYNFAVAGVATPVGVK